MTPDDGKDASKSTQAGSSAGDAALALRDAEQRLQELTEQSLGFLEELGEARRKEQQRLVLAQRIDKLENLLADARRRVASAGGTILRAAPGLGVSSLEVVIWGGLVDETAITALAAALPDTPITCLADPGEVPDGGAMPDSVQWLASTRVGNAARAFNTGMASTAGAAVLFLRAGFLPRAGAWLDLPASDPSIALVQPRLSRAAGESLGMSETEQPLWLEPCLLESAGAAEFLAHADPDAFVLSRAAFERVGCFDEDLLSPLALADFTLRANAEGMRVAGWPQLVVETASAGPTVEQECLDRDRLLALASHRPADMAVAFARADFLWKMAEEPRAAFLQSLLARLPAAADWPEARAVLTGVAHEMLAHAWSPGQLLDEIEHLVDQELELIGSVDAAAASDVRSAIDARPASMRQFLGDLRLLFDLEARIRGTLDAQKTALSRESDDLRQQLHEARQALASEQQARAKDQGRAEELAAGGGQAARERDRLQDLVREQGEEVSALRQAQVAASQGFATAREELATAREELATAREEVNLLQREFTAIAAAVDLTGEPKIGSVRSKLVEMRDNANRLTELLQVADMPDPASLFQRLIDLRGILREREKWIVALLLEVKKRRFALFPRSMQDHEVKFLEAMGRDL